MSAWELGFHASLTSALRVSRCCRLSASNRPVPCPTIVSSTQRVRTSDHMTQTCALARTCIFLLSEASNSCFIIDSATSFVVKCPFAKVNARRHCQF